MSKLLLLVVLTQVILATIPILPFIPGVPTPTYGQQLLASNVPAPRLPTGYVKLKAYTGDFLSSCINCGYGSYPDSAAFGPEQAWCLEYVGSKVAFRSSINGNYISRCQNFWYNGANYPDAVFVVANRREGPALWTPIVRPNGRYAFQADNGKFLSRSRNGNFAFVDSTDDECIIWEISEHRLPTITIKADNGQYLRVNQYIGGPHIQYYGFVVSVENVAENWRVLRIGDRIALRAPNGKYLSRCNNCWISAKYPDSAFVHLSSPDEPYSLWRPLRQPNGKWALQADNGKYLTRCTNCAAGWGLDLAFIQETDPCNSRAQWTIQ